MLPSFCDYCLRQSREGYCEGWKDPEGCRGEQFCNKPEKINKERLEALAYAERKLNQPRRRAAKKLRLLFS